MTSKTPPLTVNEVLPEQYTKLDHRIVPPRLRRTKSTETPMYKAVQEFLGSLINTLGVQSAAAQGLNKVITSVERLRAVHNHYLYLLKDHEADEGRGAVLAMLKVGYKHLFLFDETGKLRELEPPCILDFFVVPTHQRQGYGRALFDYMLNDMDVMLPDLAIDGPSEKMISFMHRNYGIEHLVRQNNNFAVVPGFFDHLESGASKVRTGPPEKGRPADRSPMYRPMSSIGSVIHGEIGESASRQEGYDAASAQYWNEDYTEWSPGEQRHDSDSESDYETPASGPARPDLKYQHSQLW